MKEVSTPSPKPYSTKPDPQTEQPDLSSTTEPADVWNPLSQFLNFPIDTSFENSRLHHDSNDCLSEFHTGNEYPSPDPSHVCPTSPSFSVAEAIDGCTAPTSPPSDPISRPPLETENIDSLFSSSLDPQPAGASTTQDMNSYPHFSGYAEPYPTISASSSCFAGTPLLSYPAACQ